MLKQKLVEEFTAKVSEVLAAGPARDVEKNLKATLTALFAKLDLVTREEFDVQAQVLARTREKLAKKEARLARLEGAAAAGSAENTEQAQSPNPPS
jgi:BMFP domain-containing protein YqiC